MNKLNIVSLTILFLAGCVALQPDALATPTPSVTKAPPASMAQETSTRLPLTETPSQEPTIEPTWTLPPTLPVSASFSKINELLQTNESCRLPCWWGITPGQTKWEEARNILFPFAKSVLDGQSKNDEFMTGLMTRYGTYQGKSSGFQQGYTIKGGIVQEIEIHLPDSSSFAKPGNILAEYGVPDEVYVGGTFEPDAINWQSFWIFLYYTEQRIFVKYSQGIQPPQPPGGLLFICFPEVDYSELYLWGPEYSFDKTLDQIKEAHFSSSLPSFLPFEDVTDLTIEQFHKIFTDPDQAPCFDTPARHWLP